MKRFAENVVVLGSTELGNEYGQSEYVTPHQYLQNRYSNVIYWRPRAYVVAYTFNDLSPVPGNVFGMQTFKIPKSPFTVSSGI